MTPVAHPGHLAELLADVRSQYGLPALAAAVIADGRLQETAAVGTRKYGSDASVTCDDAFHLGSCTKAMTATMLGTLVAEGKLAWETTIAEVFADDIPEMTSAYREVTLRQLLEHRGGLPKDGPPGVTLMDLHQLPGNAPEQRRAFLEIVLTSEPAVSPGEYLYSNAGYAVAATMAERVTGRSWESLMQERIFRPLEMETAGFGAMGKPGKTDQPWQHRVAGERVIPIEPGPLSDNPPLMWPAGGVHASVPDWSAFVLLHLGVRPNGKTIVSKELLQALHEPPSGGDYACGWLVTTRPWAGGKVLTHAGTNTMNYAVAWLAPGRRFAVLVATNQGGDDTAKACDAVAAAVIRGWLASRSSKSR